MSKMHKIATGILIGLLVMQPAIAADKKDKAARESQRRMAQLKQQLEAEKAEMQAGFDKEKAELLGKVDESEKAGDALRGSLSAQKRRVSELVKEADALRAELESLRREKAELEAANSKTGHTLKETTALLNDTRTSLAEAQRDLKSNDTQRKEISKSLVLRDQSLGACIEKNDKLYGFGRELVEFYQNPVRSSEPFTQIKRVELENIMQAYRDKIDEQRVGVAAR